MASASRVRITGIRSWIGRRSSFESTVMIVQLLISSPSGERQLSHSPANLNGSRLFEHNAKWLLCATLLLPLSYVDMSSVVTAEPSRAVRNAGLVATVSALALIIRLPITGSLTHDGIRPQRI